VAEPSLLVWRKLGKRAAGLRDQKDRVIAEPPGTARSSREKALDNSFDDCLLPPRCGEGHDTAKPRGAAFVGDVPHPRQEMFHALPVGKPRPPVPRRAHPGATPEGLDLEPGIIRQGGATGRPRHRPRLGQGVVRIRELPFRGENDVRKLVEGPERVSDVAEKGSQLVELPRIGRGQDQLRSHKVKTV
jgi:hypothetical protein